MKHVSDEQLGKMIDTLSDTVRFGLQGPGRRVQAEDFVPIRNALIAERDGRQIATRPMPSSRACDYCGRYSCLCGEKN